MSSGRITCPRCGSNNFDTVTACWKCSAPLTAGAAAPSPAPPSMPQATATLPRPATTPLPPVAPAAAPAVGQMSFADRVAAPVITAANTVGNPAAANRAAFWLGMLFPYFGLPIGLAFIMCDDRRRQEVGRLCILWSLLSSAIHLLLLIVTILGLKDQVMALLGMGAAMRRGGGGGLGGGGAEGLGI